MSSSEHDIITATSSEQSALQALDAEFQNGISTLIADGGKKFALPESLVSAFRQVVHLLAQGEAVQVIAANALLTTQEAASLLSVSRPFLMKLLDDGTLPFVMVGSHHRIATADLLRYKAERAVQRRAGLQDIVRISEEMGLYERERPYSPDEGRAE